ncbi:hypothetical protein [Microbispora sp. NPDC049125]|uniref:hypothetical protein n=1 Tax=Microbispora sp. NPDC049125 TaxID=3154929 RepID=UPI003464F44B
MSWTPPPGSIGLTYAYGLTHVRASIGQILTGEVTHYTHAFIALGGGKIMEPWPSGARISDISAYSDEYVAYGWPLGLTSEQRDDLVSVALSLDGACHGLSDYAALALTRRGVGPDRLHRRVRSGDRMVPARFVAEVYARALVPLLEGKEPHEVTLEDLGTLFMTSESWALHVPAAYYA